MILLRKIRKILFVKKITNNQKNLKLNKHFFAYIKYNFVMAVCSAIQKGTKKMELLNFWLSRKGEDLDHESVLRFTRNMIQTNIIGDGIKETRSIDRWQHKQGIKLSKIIACLKRDELDKKNHIEDDQKLHAVCSYLEFVSKEYNNSRVMKIEPNFAIAREKFSISTWKEIPAKIFDDQGLNWQGWYKLQYLHQLHISEVDPSLIAYYPSLKHMREGREVRTRFGKYISKFKDLIFYDDHREKIDVRIKNIIDRFTISYSSDKEYEIDYFSDDVNQAENWRKVYSDTRNFKSCMSENDNIGFNYCTGMNQLFLAVVRSKINNSIISRCIVRNHIDDQGGGYIRFYPSCDESPASRFLKNHLADIGFGDRADFLGCFLRTDSDYSAPYLDGDYQRADYKVINGEPYLKISDSGDYLLDRTDGFANSDEDYYCCYSCGDRTDESDLTYIEHEDWCESCRDDAFVQDVNCEWIRRDEAIYCETDNEYYHENTNGIIYSEYHGGYFFDDDFHYNEFYCDWFADDVAFYIPDFVIDPECYGLSDGLLFKDLYQLPNGEFIAIGDKHHYLNLLNGSNYGS